MRAVRVPRRNAEALRRALVRVDALDTTRVSSREGNSVAFPICADPPVQLDAFGAAIADVPETARRVSETPRDRVVREVRPSARPFVPRRWDRLGDVIVLRPPRPISEAPLRQIAAAFAHVLGAKAVVEERAITGPQRVPSVRLLWGRDTRTVHVEGGIAYALDPATVMFSSGNLRERMTLPRRVLPGEVVVDLFAGIGYFSIPIAIRARPSRVIACEENPVAFRFLQENIRRNRAWTVEPRLGDCDEVAPEGIADRVVMGLLRSGPYLRTAMRALRPEGGEVHYHEVVPSEAVGTRLTSRVEEAARKSGRTVVASSPRIVKSVAPRVLHAAVDARIGPKRVSIRAA